jgi:hypothetical protein
MLKVSSNNNDIMEIYSKRLQLVKNCVIYTLRNTGIFFRKTLK